MRSAENDASRLGSIPDPTPPDGMDWREGLDRLDALLNDCAQVVEDWQNFVRVQAVRHIVNAVRRWEDATDESIRSALWEDGVERGEPWATRVIPPDEHHPEEAD